MKIMTYNLHRCIGNLRSLGAKRVAEIIGGEGADIIGLTEFYESGNQLKHLAEALDVYYAFGGGVRCLRGEIGNGILSKYPIKNFKNQMIHSFIVKWNCLEVEISNENLFLFITHLNPGIGHIAMKSRLLQTNEVVELTKSRDGPKILLGDFNTIRKNEKVLKIISDEFNDAWIHSSGGGSNSHGYTYPSFYPKFRLDYIFTSPGISLHHAYTPEMKLSDHLPLVVEMSL